MKLRTSLLEGPNIFGRTGMNKLDVILRERWEAEESFCSSF